MSPNNPMPTRGVSLTAALNALPHGPEFRFVDRLSHLEPGRFGRGEYKVRGDEPFLKGHFPGQPIFPGVLLVEAAAQLSGIVAQSDPLVAPWPGLKLTALQRVKILGAVRPGDTIQLEATVTGRLGHLIQADATASTEGKIIMEAELTLCGETTR